MTQNERIPPSLAAKVDVSGEGGEPAPTESGTAAIDRIQGIYCHRDTNTLNRVRT